MAASKLATSMAAALVCFLLAALIWAPSIRADSAAEVVEAIGGSDSSALKAEVEQLKSKISVLGESLVALPTVPSMRVCEIVGLAVAPCGSVFSFFPAFFCG